jgi:hypothetical protein
MAHVQIRGRLLSKDFEGSLLKEATSRQGPEDQRWVTFRVYKDTEHDQYVVHRIGGSVIYHTYPTACRTAGGKPSGDVATWDDLPDDAEPCPECRPRNPRDLGDDEKVRYEFDRDTLVEMSTAEQVVDWLTRKPGGRGSSARGVTSIVVTDPVARLLRGLQEADPEFAKVQIPVPLDR